MEAAQSINKLVPLGWRQLDGDGREGPVGEICQQWDALFNS